AGRAVAALPLLKSMWEEPDGKWRLNPELKTMIGHLEQLAASPASVVAKARLERVARARQELRSYTTQRMKPEARAKLFAPEEPPTADALADPAAEWARHVAAGAKVRPRTPEP